MGQVLKKDGRIQIKKHTKYSDHPEHKSKEFDSPTFDTKMLADIKVLEIEGYNENLLQTNVHFKPISGHFREKNNKRCQISQVETIIFWYSMFMYLN